MQQWGRTLPSCINGHGVPTFSSSGGMGASFIQLEYGYLFAQLVCTGS